MGTVQKDNENDEENEGNASTEFAPGNDADYYTEEDNEGRFFGGGLTDEQKTILNIFDKAPVVDMDAFIAPSASVIGDVRIGRESSIWYGCVLRGKVIWSISFYFE